MAPFRRRLAEPLLLLCLLALIRCQSVSSLFNRPADALKDSYSTIAANTTVTPIVVSNRSGDKYDVGPFGGTSINKALQEVIGDRFPIPLEAQRVSRTAEEREAEDTFYRSQSKGAHEDGVEVTLRSSLRFRCRDYLACEYHLPVVELENVIIDKGVVYLNNPDKSSLAAIERMMDPAVMFKVTRGRLPSTLIQNNAENEWLPGPQLVIYNSGERNSRTAGPPRCRHVWDTSAFFLFPWESHNAFHALNDNVLAIVTSMVLQYLTAPSGERPPRHKTLFMFNRMGLRPSAPSLLFRLLDFLFEGDVRPANRLFGRYVGSAVGSKPHTNDEPTLTDRGRAKIEGGICVRRMAWGTPIKLFYRDSLVNLRQVVYDVLQAAMYRHPDFPGIASELFSPDSNTYSNSNGHSRIAHPATKGSKAFTTFQKREFAAGGRYVPKVVVITRNSSDKTTPMRRISGESERNFVDIFQKRGAKAVVCCDYKHVNTIPKLVSYFGYADICLGMHGAGMSNCILGGKPQIVVELQNYHAFGYDNYIKISHMSGGSYVFFDSRSVQKIHGPRGGAVIPLPTVETIVDLAMNAYNSLHDQPVIRMKRPAKNSSVTSLYPTNEKNGNISKMFDVFSKNLMVVKTLYRNIKTREEIMGPTLSVNQKDCKTLAYYRFRLMHIDEKEHKFRCDWPKIFATKISASVDKIYSSEALAEHVDRALFTT